MKEQILQTIGKSKEYTLQVAEAMPENAYSFKPSGAGWNFGELLNHIAYGIQWWEENYIRGKQTEWAPFPVLTKKEAVIGEIKKAFTSLERSAGSDKLTDQSVYGIHATLDHITHHRGQAVLYLRCKGINPPEYCY